MQQGWIAAVSSSHMNGREQKWGGHTAASEGRVSTWLPLPPVLPVRWHGVHSPSEATKGWFLFGAQVEKKTKLFMQQKNVKMDFFSY